MLDQLNRILHNSHVYEDTFSVRNIFRLRLDQDDLCFAFAILAFFIYLFFLTVNVDFLYEQCIRALFTAPKKSLFSNFFIKNVFYGTIYIFKNYFATVFSVFSFQLYPNGPLVSNIPW